MEEEDVPYLFWTAASWLGAFSTNPYDMEFLLNIAVPLAIMNRALELDESFGLVALESLSCGTPIVANDVGDLRYAFRAGD